MGEKFRPSLGDVESSPEKKSKQIKREIFDIAGERNVEQALELIGDVREILKREKEEGKGRLEDTIPEIKDGPNGDKYFVDENVAYMPGEGEAIIIGDIHGDADAITSTIEQSGFIEDMEEGEKEKKLVFTGDYADRGEEGIKALELVLDLKKRYPENVVLLRGNHEDRKRGENYTDKNCLLLALVKNKYTDTGVGEQSLFDEYNNLFEDLPGVLVTENGLVVVHAGIPNEEITSLKDLNNEEVLKQMRWNDPQYGIQGMKPNIIRESRRPEDCKYRIFGKDYFMKFMDKIGAKVMVRSHEEERSGARLFFDNKLASIFSNGGTKSKTSGYRDHVETPKFAKIRLDQLKEMWEDSDFEEVKYI
jgi:hypothetical protein